MSATYCKFHIKLRADPGLGKSVLPLLADFQWLSDEDEATWRDEALHPSQIATIEEQRRLDWLDAYLDARERDPSSVSEEDSRPSWAGRSMKRMRFSVPVALPPIID